MRQSMTSQDAATLGLRALAWLARGEGVDRFLVVSGLDPAALRARAGEPELLGAVLEFVLANEDLAAAFCEEESVPARDIHTARHLLGGPL
jgi:uncharacterized protein DUF3572